MIVITQNEIAQEYETISKYDPKCGKKPEAAFIKKKIIQLSELEKNNSWEKVMVEKIVNSVNGQGKFDELTKNDIDDVIKMFRELQEKIER